jgi:hypothetical protein
MPHFQLQGFTIVLLSVNCCLEKTTYCSNTLTFSVHCVRNWKYRITSQYMLTKSVVTFFYNFVQVCRKSWQRIKLQEWHFSINSISRKWLFIDKSMALPWPNLLCCTKTHFTINYKLQNGERDVSYPQLLHLSQERLDVGTSDLSTWDFAVLLVLPCFFTMATATTV